MKIIGLQFFFLTKTQCQSKSFGFFNRWPSKGILRWVCLVTHLILQKKIDVCLASVTNDASCNSMLDRILWINFLLFLNYFWRYVRNDRTKALMNLCVALVLSYIIFLAGITRTENKVRIKTVNDVHIIYN